MSISYKLCVVLFGASKEEVMNCLNMNRNTIKQVDTSVFSIKNVQSDRSRFYII